MSCKRIDISMNWKCTNKLQPGIQPLRQRNAYIIGRTYPFIKKSYVYKSAVCSVY